MKKFLIFDIDGTLIQTFASISGLFMQATAAHFSIPAGYSYYDECKNVTDKAVLEHLFLKFCTKLPTNAETEQVKRTYLALLEQHRVANGHFYDEVPGSIQLLHALMEHPEVHLGFATGNWKHIAQFKLNAIGWDASTQPLAASDEHDSKTSMLTALIDEESKTHTFDEIWYVGDSLYDEATAKHLNLRFLGIDFRAKGHFDANALVYPHFEDLPLNAVFGLS